MEDDDAEHSSKSRKSSFDGSGSGSEGGEGAAAADAAWVCCVCGDAECEEENPQIMCDGPCGLSVHLTCYGVLSVPEGDWRCVACSGGFPPRGGGAQPPACLICGEGPAAGMMKAAKASGAPVHVLCALATEGVYFDSVMRMEGVTVVGGERALDAHRAHKCGLCGARPGGVALRCRARGCKACVHPMCLFRGGHRLELRAGYTPDRAPIHCPEHQHAIAPPPRPEGFKEQDVAGLLDGVGVCNRQRWAEAVDFAYPQETAAEAAAAAAAAFAEGMERDRQVASAGDKDKGWRSAAAAASAALTCTRYALARHEEAMVASMGAGGSGGGSGSGSGSALLDALRALAAAAKPVGTTGGLSLAEGAGEDGQGCQALFGRPKERWKAVARALLPVAAPPDVGALLGAAWGGEDAEGGYGVAEAVAPPPRGGARGGDATLPWPPPGGLPRFLRHTLLGKRLKRSQRAGRRAGGGGGGGGGAARRGGGGDSAEGGGGTSDEGEEAAASDSQWLAAVSTSGPALLGGFTLSIRFSGGAGAGVAVGAPPGCFPEGLTPGACPAPATYLRCVLPPPAAPGAPLPPPALVEFPFCEEDEEEAECLAALLEFGGGAAAARRSGGDSSEEEEEEEGEGEGAGGAGGADGAAGSGLEHHPTAAYLRAVLPHVSVATSAAAPVRSLRGAAVSGPGGGVLRPGGGGDEVTGELWAASRSLSAAVE